MKKKVLLYLMAVILVGIYLIILVKGTDYSDLDASYYHFYIAKDLAYYTKAEEFGTYRDNTLFTYNASGNYRNQGGGWAPVDDEGTWCVGNRSDLYIFVDDPDRPHELKISVAEDMGYKNYIEVNGEYRNDINFAGDKTAVVDIPSGLKEGLNEISICTDDELKDVYGNGASGIDGRLNLYVTGVILKDKE